MVLVLALVAAACKPVPWPLLDGPGPGSVLIGCASADTAITVTVTSHLDPACTYTRGLTITASDVVLDCRGARIVDTAGNRSRGIAVTMANDAPVHDVTIRNCRIEGFVNTIRVTKPDHRLLPAGAEYAHPSADIVIEHNRLSVSRGSGIFVDAFVTGVTVRDTEITGAGSVGIYLEAGSKDNVIEDNTIVNNGYGDVKPEGLPFSLAGLDYRYLSTGREGIAVDGSRDNVIRNNLIASNSAGGIFVYKNCGEFVTQKPASWWTRLYGPTGNLIEGNTIVDAPNGIWVGSRQAENQTFMDCSDTPYAALDFQVYYRDFATDNVVHGNAFGDVQYGIRVEDDRTTVAGNVFAGGDADDLAVVVGTQWLTMLGEPVDGVVVTGNESTIPGATTPFQWIHDPSDTVDSGNLAGGAPSALVEGTQPPIDPFLFVKSFWPA